MTEQQLAPDPVCCQALRAAAVPLVLLPPEPPEVPDDEVLATPDP